MQQRLIDVGEAIVARLADAMPKDEVGWTGERVGHDVLDRLFDHRFTTPNAERRGHV
jgi:hypothetical protein